MSTWIRVLDERPNGYPRDGTTYAAGSVLRVPEAAAVAACDEASPPFAERLSEVEVEQLSTSSPSGETAADEDEPEPPNVKFSAAALDRLEARGIAPQAYDGPQTGARGQATAPDVDEWLAERAETGSSPDEDEEETDDDPDRDEEA